MKEFGFCFFEWLRKKEPHNSSNLESKKYCFTYNDEWNNTVFSHIISCDQLLNTIWKLEIHPGTCFLFMQHFIQQGWKTCKISLSLKLLSEIWQFVIDSKMKVDIFPWNRNICCYNLVGPIRIQKQSLSLARAGQSPGCSQILTNLIIGSFNQIHRWKSISHWFLPYLRTLHCLMLPF